MPKKEKTCGPLRTGAVLVLVALVAAMGCKRDPVAAPQRSASGPARPAPTAPSPGDDPSRLVTYHGIDVSHYQGEVDWARVRAAGATFAYIKATESDTVIDPRFVENWSAAGQAGVVRGAYHYFHPDVDAASQVRHFLATVTLQPGDLPPALDVEVGEGVAADEIRDDVLVWLRQVAAELGVRPVLYSDRSFFADELAAELSGHPIWVAWYPGHAQIAMGPWAGWTFWQYSATGSIAGITGEVDLDLYRGSIGNWNRFTRR